jgi:rare lipoprotein A
MAMIPVLTSTLIPVLIPMLMLGWPLAADAAAAVPQARSAPAADAKPSRPRAASAAKPRLDHSGRPRIGKASFYAARFAGQKMADGTRMDLHDDNAASRTLPLGTRARVTNLRTGKSAIVTIQDRGPYAKGRIIDLSPATARQIGINRRTGVATVRVTPLTVQKRHATAHLQSQSQAHSQSQSRTQSPSASRSPSPSAQRSPSNKPR